MWLTLGLLAHVTVHDFNLLIKLSLIFDFGIYYYLFYLKYGKESELFLMCCRLALAILMPLKSERDIHRDRDAFAGSPGKPCCW